MALFSLLLAVIAGAAGSYLLWASYFAPLASVPGPFLARYTNLWRLLSCLRRQAEVTQRKLHDELGPVVRLGPNMVSISDPAMVGEIYSRQNVLIKGDFYSIHDLNVNGKRIENIFSARDEQLNSKYLRPVMKLFSMGHLIKLEPLIDNAINSFLDHLDKRFAQPALPCDLHNWLHYVAWDVISGLTFSKAIGFMAQGKDVDNLMAINNTVMDYSSAIGMMPWLDNLFDSNPLIRIGPPAFGPFIQYCLARIAGRLTGTDDHDAARNPDMLDGFFEARASDPPEVRDAAMIAYVGANVGAGSDTVAAELRAVIYYLCKNPAAMKKLHAELDTIGPEAINGAGAVSWAKCQELPYLGACISEGFRICPGIGLPLERRVGPHGLAVPTPDGRATTVLPPGTLVGMNPYVVNRDRGVFGEDAHLFRPERWLRAAGEAESAFQARLSRMKAASLTFGAGKRACVGRNIALIESHKIVASLVRRFDVRSLRPDREWRTWNAWIVRQDGVDVVLKKRVE